MGVVHEAPIWPTDYNSSTTATAHGHARAHAHAYAAFRHITSLH